MARIALVLLALLLSLPALAADTARLNVIGFSPDGAYFAFEQYLIGDASGEPYVQIVFVDVLGNRYARPSVETGVREWEGDYSLEQARADARKAAAPVLAELGIVAGDDGYEVPAHAPVPEAPGIFGFSTYGVFASNFEGGSYELEMRTRRVAAPQCFDQKGLALEMKLRHTDVSTAEERLRAWLPPGEGDRAPAGERGDSTEGPEPGLRGREHALHGGHGRAQLSGAQQPKSLQAGWKISLQ
jgi:hypothetical protein